MKPKRRVVVESSSRPYDFNRPPKRVFVPVDELGTAGAKPFLKDAIDQASEESHAFGEAKVYEYRLVDSRPRAHVKIKPLPKRKPKRKPKKRAITKG